MVSGSTLGFTFTPSASVTEDGIATPAGEFRNARWAHGKLNGFSSV